MTLFPIFAIVRKYRSYFPPIYNSVGLSIVAAIFVRHYCKKFSACFDIILAI